MGRLDGRVALITGASRGFGRAIALAFAHEGADVAVNYRTNATGAAEVAAVVQKLGRRALVVEADVASEDEVRELVAATLSRFGRLDILVNNAGIMERGLFADVPVSAYARMFATNVTGTMLCTRAALPAMMERRYGRIVNRSSRAPAWEPAASPPMRRPRARSKRSRGRWPTRSASTGSRSTPSLRGASIPT